MKNLKHGRTIMSANTNNKGTKNMFLALGKMDKGSMGSVKGVSKDNMKEYIKSNT